MSVFKRIKDMTKATIHDMLDKVEDPVVMLNQYIRDMEEEISKAEVTVAKQMATERRMLQRLEEAKSNMNQWEERAERALLAGDEQAAREALDQKLYFEERVQEFAAMHEKAKEQATQLHEQLHEMKDEFYQMRNKRNELVARAQWANARKQMAEISTVNTIESSYASKGFHRMEEKIMEMEIEADIVRGPYRRPSITQDPLRNDKIDQQLEALKQKIESSSEDNTSQQS